MKNDIPLSLYIHFPWCLRKCPYCDFHSHEFTGQLPEPEYIAALTNEIKQKASLAQNRKLKSIFFGGGTPSLLSASAIDKLLYSVHQNIPFEKNIEITIELNPGTSSQSKLKDLHSAGINRLSIGIQSFQDDSLKKLGRIHNSEQAKQTIVDANHAGFTNINCDIMHGLPKQTVKDALSDLKTVIQFSPQHISWYELTIEPDTPFGKSPPNFPGEETLADIQREGNALLENHAYHHYEISAYAKPNFQCQHNLNYWQFGDYLGLGQGAHGKITDVSTAPFTINRQEEKNYTVSPTEIPLEFMLNALRLTDGFPATLFEEHTGIKLKQIELKLSTSIKQGLIKIKNNRIKPTTQGQRYLNHCLVIFSE